MKYKSFIERSLIDVSKLARDNFGKVQGLVKSNDNNQVLTETDLEIGKYLVAQILEKYPNQNIIDEEAGIIDKSSDYTWAIDPIDGTSNFANGIPTFGIMIGLLHNGSPIAGGISLPVFNEIYCAEKGYGAYCNGSKIKVSPEEKLSNILLAYGIDGHQENPKQTQEECEILSKIVLAIRNLRTSNSAFDSVNVASGKYGIMMNQTSKIWDNVAQQIIIEEAGGIYTDFYGNQIDYSDPLRKANDNFTWCAGSKSLHKQIQALIKDS